jgi:hypothetical protein
MANKVIEKVLKVLDKAMDVVAEECELDGDDKTTIHDLLKKEMMVGLKDLKLPSKKSPDGSSKSEKKPRKKSAYNFYIQDQFKKAKESETNKSTTELMSEFSKKWKKLSESEQNPYQEMAEKYNAENFADTGSDKGKPKKLNGYNVFMKEKMAEYKESGGTLSPKDRLKKIAGEWKKLDDEEKAEYKEKAKVMSSGGDSDAEAEPEKKTEKKTDKKPDAKKADSKTPKNKAKSPPAKKTTKKKPEPEPESDSDSDSDSD